LAETLQFGIGEALGGISKDSAALIESNHSTDLRLICALRELCARVAATAEASSGCQGLSAGFVVDLASGSEGAEALADGGGGDAELGGQLSQGQGTTASPAFPPGEQLQGIDGGVHGFLRA